MTEPTGGESIGQTAMAQRRTRHLLHGWFLPSLLLLSLSSRMRAAAGYVSPFWPTRSTSSAVNKSIQRTGFASTPLTSSIGSPLEDCRRRRPYEFHQSSRARERTFPFRSERPSKSVEDCCRSRSVLSRLRGGAEPSYLRGEAPKDASGYDGSTKMKESAGDKLLGAGYSRSLVFAGDIFPVLRRLFTGTSKKCFVRGWNAVTKTAFVFDIIVITAFALGTEVVAKFLYNVFLGNRREKTYEESTTSAVAKKICQLGQISGAVYTVELAAVFFAALLDGKGKWAYQIPKTFAALAFGIWIAQSLQSIAKKRYLRRFINMRRKATGKVIPYTEDDGSAKTILIDRIVEGVLYFCTGLVVLDTLNIKAGVVVRSFLAVGGLSSVLIGLSFKEPATQLVQGVNVLLTNKLTKGDEIRLGDGTSGKVEEVGWLDTVIRGGDDIVFRIPNDKVASQRIYNVSRMRMSQVKQEFRFRYEDINRVEQLCDDIKKEIMSSCPSVVTDGTRAFRALWTDCKADHIVVTVDTHHRIQPATTAYWENKQNVLLAVARAVKKNGCEFALPTEISIGASSLDSPTAEGLTPAK